MNSTVFYQSFSHFHKNVCVYASIYLGIKLLHAGCTSSTERLWVGV